MFFLKKFFNSKNRLSFGEISKYINSLSIESAKKLFLKILIEDVEFLYVDYQYSNDAFNDESLNESINDFFRIFDCVIVSEVSFDKSAIGVSSYHDEYKIIGGDGFFDIVTSSQKFDVHYVDNEDPQGLALKGIQQSAWHYLLVNLLFLNQELIAKINMQE